MNGVVLRQVCLEGAATLPSRAKAAPVMPPAEDPLAAAIRAGYEEGLRRGREEGRRQGQEAGQAEGLATAEASARQAAQVWQQQARKAQEEGEEALRHAIGALAQAMHGIADAAEADLVALCFDATCKVVGEAAADASVVRSQVRALLAQWRGAPPVAIHLHPVDVPLLQASGIALACVPDPAVAAGGCILRGTQGALDGRLDSLLAETREVLLAANKRRQAVA